MPEFDLRSSPFFLLGVTPRHDQEALTADEPRRKTREVLRAGTLPETNGSVIKALLMFVASRERTTSSMDKV